MGQIDGPAEVMQPVVIPGRSLIVLYGSETGNAQDIAIELGQMAQRLHFQTTVDEMDDFKLSDLLRASLVIFVTSTTGQGDMPKNTLKFWKNLRREKLTNSNCFQSVKFTIFGLGDSSYQKFNWAARKLQVRLLQLGASEFFRAGEGDERHDNGIDSIYLPWYQDLRATLLADFPLPDLVAPIPDDSQLPPKYPVRLASTMASATTSAHRSHLNRAPSKLEQQLEDLERESGPWWFARHDETWERQHKRSVDTLDKQNILKDHPEKYSLTKSDKVDLVEASADRLAIPGGFYAYLNKNERVTPIDHWQDVRLLSLEIHGDEIPQREALRWAGQLTVTIFPRNFAEDVEELIAMMGWESVADESLEIDVKPKGLHLKLGPGSTTLRNLLLYSLDFTAIPKRNFILALAQFTDSQLEKDRLLELTNYISIQEYYDYACRPRRTILELLRDFPGVKIPLDRILDLFQPIRGRDFSVCNGGESLVGKTKLADSDGEFGSFLKVEILVAIVEYKTIIRKPRQGLCSRYLKSLKPGSVLTVKITTGSPPRLVELDSASRPMIAVATGTGIAPIRALVQERSNWRAPGDTLIFFGCRNQKADYHFESEWKLHPNVMIFPAFSRDNEKHHSSAKPAPFDIFSNQGTILEEPPQYDENKNYVQHLIRREARTVVDFLKRKPIVCVCGNAGRMPVSVRNAFLDVLLTTGEFSDREAAAKWFDDSKNLTFWQECW
ncbi:NADPH-dependent diflavin oxidoreductase 1 [Podospora fimiseda]|uniref:NADPH-dependent diflavin oxidoreductase 1 n=1 Tax=Podospora fimiseda TaxID=252190 RepID=A0AAN7BUZ1_9PEZI|nr:NADPH-dependent diflavin oxidoreductase 1 [Podospora fimiseda]